MKTRHRREEREDKVEKRVDIYESIVMVTGSQSTQDGGPAVQTIPPRVTLTLAVLCVLLFVVSSVLFGLYVSLEAENNRLILEIKHLTTYCSDGEQPEGGATAWQVFACSCYYVSADKKNWTDSRTDCQRRGADLVTMQTKDKHDVVKKLVRDEDVWIGLQLVKTSQWTWKWTDGTPLSYKAWQTEVNINPQSPSRAFMVSKGTWQYADNGTKHWICEKAAKRELCDDVSVATSADRAG